MGTDRRMGLRQPRKIRYSDAEWSAIVGQARAAGQPPARYVREASLGAVPKARRSHEHDEIVYQLGRIGTTITQLRTMAKEAGYDSQQVSIETVLTELLAAVRRIS